MSCSLVGAAAGIENAFDHSDPHRYRSVILDLAWRTTDPEGKMSASRKGADDEQDNCARVRCDDWLFGACPGAWRRRRALVGAQRQFGHLQRHGIQLVIAFDAGLHDSERSLRRTPPTDEPERDDARQLRRPG